MIKEVTHLIQACPVCGRPLQVCIDYVGHLLTCQHCRGQFVASYPDTSDRGKTERSNSLLHRADRLLAILARHRGVHRCWPLVRRHKKAERCTPSVCIVASRKKNVRTREDTSCESQSIDAPNMPTVLLVEYRDDVFARLAADLAARGIRAMRAVDGTQAIRRYVRRPTDLLIVNADQPDQSAWLLTAKLHLTHPTARIWVYKRRLSTSDVATANFLQIDGLIDYESDLCRLAATILDSLLRLPTHETPKPNGEHGTDADQAVA